MLDGPECQQTKHSFGGQGYAWFPPIMPCFQSHISLEFLAESANGLLLYNGPLGHAHSGEREDFIAVGKLRLLEQHEVQCVSKGRRDAERTPTSNVSVVLKTKTRMFRVQDTIKTLRGLRPSQDEDQSVLRQDQGFVRVLKQEV